jgi:hypothetical protein
MQTKNTVNAVQGTTSRKLFQLPRTVARSASSGHLPPIGPDPATSASTRSRCLLSLGLADSRAAACVEAEVACLSGRNSRNLDCFARAGLARGDALDRANADSHSRRDFAQSFIANAAVLRVSFHGHQERGGVDSRHALGLLGQRGCASIMTFDAAMVYNKPP